MVIGLTGKYAAGKGTVAEVLKSRGYRYHSLSDTLRDELKRRGIPESREALRQLGNELRERDGAGALAVGMLPLLSDGALHLVDSIRNPAEVEALRSLEGFVLIGVDADPRVRFERLLERGRQGDPKTWEAFCELEGKETASDNPKAQQLAATFALSDHVVHNDSTLEALENAVDLLLRKIEG